MTSYVHLPKRMDPIPRVSHEILIVAFTLLQMKEAQRSVVIQPITVKKLSHPHHKCKSILLKPGKIDNSDAHLRPESVRNNLLGELPYGMKTLLTLLLFMATYCLLFFKHFFTLMLYWILFHTSWLFENDFVGSEVASEVGICGHCDITNETMGHHC